MPGSCKAMGTHCYPCNSVGLNPPTIVPAALRAETQDGLQSTFSFTTAGLTAVNTDIPSLPIPGVHLGPAPVTRLIHGPAFSRTVPIRSVAYPIVCLSIMACRIQSYLLPSTPGPAVAIRTCTSRTHWQAFSTATPGSTQSVERVF